MEKARETFKVNYFHIKSVMNERKGTQRSKKTWNAKGTLLTRLFHLSTSSNKWKMKMLHHSNVPINVWKGKKKIFRRKEILLRNDELSLVNFNTFNSFFKRGNRWKTDAWICQTLIKLFKHTNQKTFLYDAPDKSKLLFQKVKKGVLTLFYCS